MRTCANCKQEKALTEFRKRRAPRTDYQPYCKPCSSARSLAYQHKNPEKHAERSRRYKQKLRGAVLEAYGGKCACCGEVRPEFLAVDHVNGGGTKMRKSGFSSTATVHKFLRDKGFPKDDYRLLCHNCNCSRGFYGYCPHESERKEGV